MGVRGWPWWRLLIKITPMLNVHRTEDMLKSKLVRNLINILYNNILAQNTDKSDFIDDPSYKFFIIFFRRSLKRYAQGSKKLKKKELSLNKQMKNWSRG